MSSSLLLSGINGWCQSSSTPVLPTLQVSQVVKQITFVSPTTHSHQGYATDGTHHFTFDNMSIYEWNLDWTLMASNTAVFAGTTGMNHLGDGDFFNNTLYLVSETWVGCGNFTGQSLLTFDSTSLLLTSIHNVSADNHECSGLAVVPTDGANGVIYVTSYCDGSKIWEYDLSTFALIGTIPLSQNITYIQGIAWHNGTFYISQNSGIIYSMDYNGNVALVFSTPIPGSHEGLKYTQGQIRWLIDGGLGTNQFIYYVSLNNVALTYPISAAGWIVEQSPGINQPWTPVPSCTAISNANSISVFLARHRPAMFSITFASRKSRGG